MTYIQEFFRSIGLMLHSSSGAIKVLVALSTARSLLVRADICWRDRTIARRLIDANGVDLRLLNITQPKHISSNDRGLTFIAKQRATSPHSRAGIAFSFADKDAQAHVQG